MTDAFKRNIVMGLRENRRRVFFSLLPVALLLAYLQANRLESWTELSIDGTHLRNVTYPKYRECRHQFNDDLLRYGFPRKHTPLLYGIFSSRKDPFPYYVVLGLGEMLPAAVEGRQNYQIMLNATKWRKNTAWHLKREPQAYARGTASIYSEQCEMLTTVDKWTIVLQCSFVGVSDPSNFTGSRASVVAISKSDGSFSVIYPPLLICSHHSAIVKNKVYLAACTQVGKSHFGRIAEWIEYHKIIGFEHFVFYINEPDDEFNNITSLLEPVYGDLITLIPNYVKGVKGFLLQTSLQSECIYRMKGLTEWLALHDVDEFFQIYPPTNLIDFLRKRTTRQGYPVGGLSFANWFFGPNEINAPANQSFLLEWQLRSQEFLRHRSKLIVRPEHVVSIFVHWLTQGDQTVQVDPLKEGRLCHYRFPVEINFANELSNQSAAVNDVSMSKDYGVAVAAILRAKPQMKS